MMVHINKSSIYLLFNDFKECLDSCLLGIKDSEKFKDDENSIALRYEFKLYTILFRLYQANKMRK
jgi:hypothetical protein